MQTVLATLLLLVVGIYADCQPAAQVDGIWEALCVDETSGIEFVMMDLNGVLDDHRSGDIAGAMYGHYIDGLSDNTTSSISTVEERDLESRWQNCIAFVTGICASDYTPAWFAGLSAFAVAIAQLIISSQTNSKTNQKPRSICMMNNTQGTLCVSWAAYYQADMSKDQIQDIATGCQESCQLQGWSCEARVVTESATQYWCVSSRADHCSTNLQIPAC